jgi:hypothetical protein
MATLLSALETAVRDNLVAPAATDQFWTSAEIIRLINLGAKDLWRKLKDTYQKHHYTIDITNVSLAASSNALSGVPVDVHDVTHIRARVPSSYPNLRFVRKDYASDEFEAALAVTAQEATQIGIIFYDLVGAGGPVAAPTIKAAPQVNAEILLELGYVPTIGSQTSAQDNPIPGESDQALIAYATAFCLAKQREDQQPDPTWLQIYATEAENIITGATPRSLQDPEIAMGMFENWDDD